MRDITKEELSYIAGFIDGDGCILAQIVSRKDYKHKFQIRVSVILYQKSIRHWFLLNLHNKLKIGNLRKRNDGMSELYIVGNTPVKNFLTILKPYLIIKKSVANLVLEIIEKNENVNIKTRSDFIEVCELVDKTAEFTDSKKRFINTTYVKSYWDKI